MERRFPLIPAVQNPQTASYVTRKECQEEQIGGNHCAIAGWGLFALAMYALWNLTENPDDYLGFAINKANVPSFTDPNASHVLVVPAPGGSNEQEVNGGVKLVYHVGPPPAPATIFGDMHIAPGGGACQWNASTSLANPVSWQWSVDYIPVGTNSSQLWYTPSGSSFVLRIAVRNDVGDYASETWNVTVSEGGAVCPF